MARPVARSSFIQPKQITPSVYFQAVRCYAASAGLSRDEVTGRIMDLLKNFDKVMGMRSNFGPVTNAIAGQRHLKGSFPTMHGRFAMRILIFAQLNAESHFHNDLGLDSLDTVEVVMAIEEVSRNAGYMRKSKLTVVQEFSIEIPDKEADAIHSGMYFGECWTALAY